MIGQCLLPIVEFPLQLLDGLSMTGFKVASLHWVIRHVVELDIATVTIGQQFPLILDHGVRHPMIRLLLPDGPARLHLPEQRFFSRDFMGLSLIHI